MRSRASCEICTESGNENSPRLISAWVSSLASASNCRGQAFRSRITRTHARTHTQKRNKWVVVYRWEAAEELKHEHSKAPDITPEVIPLSLHHLLLIRSRLATICLERRTKTTPRAAYSPMFRRCWNEGQHRDPRRAQSRPASPLHSCRAGDSVS